MTPSNRLAVLIDADNISSALCKTLIQEIANYGVASVKRAYGDWTTPQLSSWKSMLHEYAISPKQQFSSACCAELLRQHRMTTDGQLSLLLEHK